MQVRSQVVRSQHMMDRPTLIGSWQILGALQSSTPVEEPFAYWSRSAFDAAIPRYMRPVHNLNNILVQLADLRARWRVGVGNDQSNSFVSDLHNLDAELVDWFSRLPEIFEVVARREVATQMTCSLSAETAWETRYDVYRG
jgi:hypothetical protein